MEDAPLQAEADEVEELGVVHLGEGLFGSAGQDGIGGVLFFGDEGVDFFLQGAGGDEFVDKDVALLADAEGAVGRLVLDGGIPPAVEVDDVAGGGEEIRRAHV